ncbi:TspO/MBR family protein [Natronospira bacteriovora]|uniref:TspO/MBR family protein n=1 Tax=Natronospira bacteriovora TaxID=3069753 RepID=A0ABU0WBB4_9GAMM|nr:TspO/MBR family protein [Natronospira sp. AB-CW4]MDQ2070230.1 TspO/MBR family protein [Natronospira sp. AB-CW4]
MNSMKGLGGLVAWLMICFSASLFGILFPPGEWYAALDKPAWNPPDWVFGPVWTLLYAMMAVAAWRVWWRRGLSAARLALAVFLFQLVLNALWSAIFFGLQMPGAAFLHILILLAAITLTMVLFRREDPMSVWLLLPYWLWVAFASVLNFTLWWMN